MTLVDFHVKGMSCAGCAQSIERRLRSTPGVQSADVDLANAVAHVTYDETAVSPDALEKTIEALGFDVVYGMGRQ